MLLQSVASIMKVKLLHDTVLDLVLVYAWE